MMKRERLERNIGTHVSTWGLKTVSLSSHLIHADVKDNSFSPLENKTTFYIPTLL